MIKRTILLIVSTVLTVLVSAQEKPLSAGMLISKTVRIKKNIYQLTGNADTTKAVIVIQGNDIVVDFNNAELRGSTKTSNPDEFSGIAVLVQNGKNITIRNLKARGYKIALLARNVEGMILENCDFSYNYRQHLNSTQEKEDISDWLSHHHNENDEWLRYGSAMYLKDCNKFWIRGCRVTGGQNGLMLVRCYDGLVVNNDFSFNSGLGIGMYRSSRNRIAYNRLVFNIRGYSHGVYNRGQDSAGILVYEQSSDNIFYKNNATHGGDGFFLWAGQTTMDSGNGGCNDNMLYGNDFSYASNNGIEATFSRNMIMMNIINECDYGIWGGYSYETVIRNNRFKNNRTAIAIEHGQDNAIFMNLFNNNKEAVRLWARKQQPPDWGYAQHRDTRSIKYDIHDNMFTGNERAFRFTFTDSIQLYNNYVPIEEARALQSDTSLHGLLVMADNDTLTVPFFEGDKMDGLAGIAKAGRPLNLPDTKYAGRNNIMVTEWGPYDFRYPLIWNTNPADSTTVMKFRVLGPAGKWKVRRVSGVKNLSAVTGRIPANFTAEKIAGELTDIIIEMEYLGPSFVNIFGEVAAANRPYRFRFTRFFQPINWEVQFYSLDTAVYNPVNTGSLFSPLERKAPFKTEQKDRLDYAWWGGIKERGAEYKQFITIANGSADFRPGEYELSVTWDDAVRVYIDEKLVINEWEPSKHQFDESPNRKVRIKLGGMHWLRVEHLELGGFATLNLKIKPVE